MPTKVKKTKGSLSFDEYKAIKDEIIEISEHRFENILTKRLKEFKNSLMEELNTKFDAMDSKFDAIDSKFNAIDSKFDSLEKRLTFITWFLPLFITLLSLIMKYFKN